MLTPPQPSLALESLRTLAVSVKCRAKSTIIAFNWLWKTRYFFQSLSSLENEPVKILSSSLKILLVNLCLRLLGKGPGQGMSDRTSKMRGLNQHPLWIHVNLKPLHSKFKFVPELLLCGHPFCEPQRSGVDAANCQLMSEGVQILVFTCSGKANLQKRQTKWWKETLRYWHLLALREDLRQLVIGPLFGRK